jgi:hypothetical protein
MLNRHENGEPEEFARLRGSIVKACDIAHFNKVMTILKKEAKDCGITIQMALFIWERAQCPDLTTRSGMSEYNRVYNREMSVLD